MVVESLLVVVGALLCLSGAAYVVVSRTAASAMRGLVGASVGTGCLSLAADATATGLFQLSLAACAALLLIPAVVTSGRLAGKPSQGSSSRESRTLAGVIFCAAAVGVAWLSFHVRDPGGNLGLDWPPAGQWQPQSGAPLTIAMLGVCLLLVPVGLVVWLGPALLGSRGDLHHDSCGDSTSRDDEQSCLSPTSSEAD